jgi:hypothetical protein
MARSANDNRPKFPKEKSTTATDAAPQNGHDDTERSFEQLPFAGQLLIWGMRHWVMALKTKQDFAAMTGDGFDQFALGSAGQALDELFQMIAVSATRQIDIRCVKCRNISEDEALLLDCLAAAQEERFPLAYAGILEILPPAAARHAMPTVISLAEIFAHAGLTLALDKPVLVPSDTLAPAQDLGNLKTPRQATPSPLQRIAGKLADMEIPALVH